MWFLVLTNQRNLILKSQKRKGHAGIAKGQLITERVGLVKKMAITLVCSGILQHKKMKNTHHPNRFKQHPINPISA